MKVEIWSDVVCPFCYIGKRRFEKALSSFPGKDQVEIEWKSFQLSPDSVTDPGKNINQFLAEHKGITVEEARRMNDYVTQMALGVGLHYDFDKVVVANTFKAHRALHFAKAHGLQSEMKEQILAAYFAKGMNVDDNATLIGIGELVGLSAAELKRVLESDEFAGEVVSDIMEARQLGIRGVPFFVFDRKYAVSGAQDAAVFADTLERAFAERLAT